MTNEVASEKVNLPAHPVTTGEARRGLRVPVRLRGPAYPAQNGTEHLLVNLVAGLPLFQIILLFAECFLSIAFFSPFPIRPDGPHLAIL